MPWVVIGDGADGEWAQVAVDFYFLVTDADEFLITDDDEFLVSSNDSNWSPVGPAPGGGWIPIGA